QRGKKLIADGYPLRSRNTLLEVRPCCTLAQTKKPAAATKPTDVDSLCLSIDAPGQSCVGRIIPGMNGRRRSKSDKVTAVLIGLAASVLKIDVHFNHVVVFRLRRFFERKPFPNEDLFLCRPLKLHKGV